MKYLVVLILCLALGMISFSLFYTSKSIGQKLVDMNKSVTELNDKLAKIIDR